MISKLSLVLLLSATICAGQSDLTEPGSGTQSDSANGQAPEAGAAGINAGGTAQIDAFPVSAQKKTAIPVPPRAKEPIVQPAASRIAGPLMTRSEFEQFAEDATGRRLPVYGRQLFDLVPTTFAPLENVPVPADYVIGPGDQLLIRAWGKIELDSQVTVDRNGQISLPRIGTLTVAGLRNAQVEGYLHNAIAVLFKDFDLSVTLGQLRSIQIFLLGNARQPGAYTVSSLSTLVDALFASGGPSATGTMRRIQLRRGNITVSEFDLYDLILSGDKSRDARLLPGDVIFIPAIGSQIAISGDVNQPGIYELKGETTVGAALKDAGGITSLADAEKVVLERIENHSSREVQELRLDDAGRSRQVKDGDLVWVFPLSPKFANAVTLRGSVSQPGLYLWKEGMRISDLISSRAALITRRYWNRQNHLVRPENDNPFAIGAANGLGNQFGDQRTDAFGKPYSETAANLHDDQPETAGSITVAGIGKNSAEINWEYALIERLDERDLSTRLIPFNLGNALDNPTSADNQTLKPGDLVTVLSRADLELPMEKHATFVTIGGEVNAPGIYRANSDDTLRDIVQRAGGLTQHSYLYASILNRVSTRNAQEAALRQSEQQMQHELIAKYANATPQAGQSGTEQQGQLAMQQAALARLTAVRPTGRVVLAMKPDAASVSDIPEFPLEDGDAFYIPPRLSTVQVAGAVYSANAFRYEPGQQLITYLNAAGGATRDADAKRIFVIRADGSVISRQSRNMHSHGSYENLVLLPGDAIVVPDKLRVSSKMNEFLQWTQFTSQLALTAAALNSIK